MNRIIKKYPNRRLYDTEESRYITLADIRDLTLRDVPFTVVDKKTGNNITRAILLQVISDQEQAGDAVMSEAFLSKIIRAHGNVSPDILAQHLDNALAGFLSPQNQLLGNVRQVIGGDLEPPAAENPLPAR